MSNKEIHKYFRQGAWNSSYSYRTFYTYSWLYFYEYEKILSVLEKKEKFLIEKYGKDSDGQQSCYISYETRYIQDEIHRKVISAHLFACLAIEGFINHYGVRRLGQNFYKTTIERIGLTEKISILYLLCFEKRLENNGPLLKSIRKMFDVRNSIVHPKTRETKKIKNRYVFNKPKINNLHEAFQIMEDFITSICEMDEDIANYRDYIFKKPSQDFDELLNQETIF